GRRVGFDTTHRPFATFDYATLCQVLASQLGDVQVAVAPFGGIDPDGTLRLGARRVRAAVLIDASGWRRVLARALGAPPLDRAHTSTGVETGTAHAGCALEFWFRPPGRPDGVHWAFPAGDHVREGTASYLAHPHGLKRDLTRFTHVDELPAKAIHGGAFPSRLAEPVTDKVFLVGDAAGQCLPLTGEGIRPALVFGQEAGRQARAVLLGRQDLPTALARYRTAVTRTRPAYRTLEHMQSWALHLPPSVVAHAVRTSASPRLSPLLQAAYWQVANPDTLRAAPDTKATRTLSRVPCTSGPAAHRAEDATDLAACAASCDCPPGTHAPQTAGCCLAP
ncbi:MAG: hypothetical protein J0I40_14195, partial [Cellulomonas sp.]|nr:hypothetical protein [Cellulomonas sp.]